MSLVIGINCRLNMLETLLSEIKKKLPVNESEEDEDEGSEESNATDEQENETEVQEALEYSAQVICSIVSDNENPEMKMEEKAAEIYDKGERKK